MPETCTLLQGFRALALNDYFEPAPSQERQARFQLPLQL
jgi:hypothetical protein